MTELQSRWMQAVEDYYRDQYPRTMRAKVAEILPGSDAALRALYNVLIRSVSAQYRTVPDVIAVQAALSEVHEAYPELSAPPVPLLEDMPDSTQGAEWIRLWKESLAAGISPRDYGPMQELISANRADSANQGGGDNG